MSYLSTLAQLEYMCEKYAEVMREVLGARWGEQAGEVTRVHSRPAMAAGVRGVRMQGAEGGDEGDRCDRTHDSKRA